MSGVYLSFGGLVGKDERGRFVKLTREPEAHGAAVNLNCPICIGGVYKIGWREGKLVHRVPGGFQECPDWDTEVRHIAEPFGFFIFAWWPTRCRNGKLRWLRSLERHTHQDGTFSYTLGNRAH